MSVVAWSVPGTVTSGASGTFTIPTRGSAMSVVVGVGLTAVGRGMLTLTGEKGLMDARRP